MEKGHYQKGLIHRNAIPIGIDLGFYGCAEHNRGIAELSEKFGIRHQSGLFGYEARKITVLPTGLHFAKSTDSSYLILERRLSKKDIYQKGQMIEVDVSPEEREERLEKILNHKLTRVGSNQATLATAWDNHKFAIHAMNSNYGQIMEDIYNAFLGCDIVICDRGPLVNGLGIMIYSRIPEELKKEFDAESEMASKIKS